MQEIDRRQQILEGALKVFSTEGFHKASIKKIARAANIKSSALIYHYFKDKKALLNALVSELSPLANVSILKEEMQEQLLEMPPEILLKQLANTVLSILEDEAMRNLIRLFLSEAVRMPEVAETLIDTQQTMLNFLVRYLDYQQSRGLFREHNPEVAARAFIGMILVNIFVRLVFLPLAEGMPDGETYVNEVVQIYLDGLRS